MIFDFADKLQILDSFAKSAGGLQIPFDEKFRKSQSLLKYRDNKILLTEELYELLKAEESDSEKMSKEILNRLYL